MQAFGANVLLSSGSGPASGMASHPHLNGISAVQFISTSNFTIHTLTDLKAVYLNIFTCKDFDVNRAVHFTRNYFLGDVVTCETIIRK